MGLHAGHESNGNSREIALTGGFVMHRGGLSTTSLPKPTQLPDGSFEMAINNQLKWSGLFVAGDVFQGIIVVLRSTLGPRAMILVLFQQRQ